MSRRKNPIVGIFSLAFVGAILTVIVNFGIYAHRLIKAGESLTSFPLGDLLFKVMELQWWAIYGAVGGAVLGILLALVDLFRYGGRGEDYTWATKDEGVNPFAEDEVKTRRMKMGDQYLKERDAKDGKGDTR